MTSFATLNDLLRARGFDARTMVAIRNALHPDDICESFRTIDDVARAGALPMLDCMQDGPLIEHDLQRRQDGPQLAEAGGGALDRVGLG